MEEIALQNPVRQHINAAVDFDSEPSFTVAAIVPQFHRGDLIGFDPAEIKSIGCAILAIYQIGDSSPCGDNISGLPRIILLEVVTPEAIAEEDVAQLLLESIAYGSIRFHFRISPLLI